jgi:outer membrane protein assembly factor BamA
VVGQPASDALVSDVAARLEKSGRFSGVEVRKRYLSIDDPSRILLVIVVDERPGVAADDLTPGAWKRVTASGMWLPVLGYEDGYGFSYGARFSFVDPIGPRSRVSVPLTWGGERQARVELERTFTGPAVARVAGGAGIHRRENPFYEIGDTRRDVWGRIESAPRSWLRAGVSLKSAAVDFADIADTLVTVGADLAVDTRVDPALPRNAVYATLAVERLRFDAASVGAPAGLAASEGTTGSTRVRFDGRAYLGLFRQSVLAVRAQSITARDPLPLFEKSLLGGLDSLRGYDAGTWADDNLAAVSTEWIVPLTSPLSVGRLGVKLFADAATAYPSRARLADQPFTWSYGVGMFLNATIFSIGLDVGWPDAGGGPNAHFQLGVRLSK